METIAGEPKTSEDTKTLLPHTPEVSSIVKAPWYEPMSVKEALEQKVLPMVSSYALAPRTKKMDRQIKKILEQVYAEADADALMASAEESSKALADMAEVSEEEMEEAGMKAKNGPRPFPGCKKPLGFKKAKADKVKKESTTKEEPINEKPTDAVVLVESEASEETREYEVGYVPAWGGYSSRPGGYRPR
jgi:hypothetical protein